MGDPEEDLFQEAGAYLAEGPAAVIPVYDIDEVAIAGFLPDTCQNNEMRGKMSFEFTAMVLFMKKGIVHIEKGKAVFLNQAGKVVVQVIDMGADEVGAPGMYLVSE